MKEAQGKTIYLKDYQPPVFVIEEDTPLFSAL